MYIFIYINIYIHIHIYSYIHIYICTWIHMYMYLYIYIYMYIYRFIYVHVWQNYFSGTKTGLATGLLFWTCKKSGERHKQESDYLLGHLYGLDHLPFVPGLGNWTFVRVNCSSKNDWFQNDHACWCPNTIIFQFHPTIRIPHYYHKFCYLALVSRYKSIFNFQFSNSKFQFHPMITIPRYCNKLRQHAVTHYNTMQHTATHYNSALQYVAVCCILNHTATYCNTL